MSVPSQNSSKKGTIARSQSKKNRTLAEEIKETSQGSHKPKPKKNLLDISVGSISDPDISARNKSIIKKLDILAFLCLTNVSDLVKINSLTHFSSYLQLYNYQWINGLT